MKYCRIDLSKTNYKLFDESFFMQSVQRDECMDLLTGIYIKYCRYKNFDSVMPLFEGMVFDKYTDVVCYHHKKKIVAFSLIKRYDKENAEALQFAWDYENPELRLGIRSLESECAAYKMQGYKYLYLGLADEYKKQIDGYEELGKI